ncbi:alpha/beta hydrolase [Kaustia mangrovi]|uniref:Alpha/beta hydrolase n=1 Tax=Kaustia mangrovi TaxID=2593653 RepID=A0A7S8C3G1_9HYPH|nr:alpha/beta hydrolase [Kaustia mangrovi]QPC42694.1 alpha/beta hydrolase [Kaustia mangrovi]
MTDYRTLLDAETQAFVEHTNAFYPPDAHLLPIARSRAIYDKMCRAFSAGRPDGVTVRTDAIPADRRSIPIRTYRADAPGDAAVLYFHGGGFMLGGLDSHDDICAEICAGTGCETVSVDYRLAPEHKDTASLDDAVAAFEWLAETVRGPIVLVGESAGGMLAACLAHGVRNHRRAPAGQVLIYPSLGGDMTAGSYVTHADAPLLTARDVAFYNAVRTDGRDVSGDPRYTPLAEPDLSGVAPTAVFTAQCDPLSSDGEAYRDGILAAGGQADWHEEQGLVHGYLRARHTVGRARESFARILREIVRLAAPQRQEARVG